MPNTTGNFQDLVQLSADTFYHLGEALSVGNPSASTVSFGFSNSGGQALLAAAQTTNQTIWLPSNSSGNQTLLTNWNLSAGTTSNNLSALTLSNSNNVSFGLNGSVVTASATVASSQGSINVSAGTTSNNLSAVTFGNGSNVSFGLSTGAGIGTITASVASSLTNINVSAGTTSNNLSAVTFANSNGLPTSFGLSNTASYIRTGATAAEQPYIIMQGT
jgi:hypothetical protein